MRLLLKALILFYRRGISPFIPGGCRFRPTCSEYGLEAVERYGARRGGWLTFRRICRCHPIRAFGGGEGFDPVPDRLPKR